MQRVLTVDNMRKSDAATISGGVAGRELMYRAGAGILNELSIEYGAEIAIVCGGGNNAGDGYVMAMILQTKGINSTIYLAGSSMSEDGKYYYEKCLELGVRIVNISDNPHKLAEDIGRGDGRIIIMDCLLGTGFKGVPREPIKSIIEVINDIKCDSKDMVTVVSVDINSGLNGDSGQYECCVKSDITISIGGIKPGLLLNSAKDVIGEVRNIDIGIEPINKPYYLIENEDIKELIKKRKNESNKGTYGYIALIGGSFKYSGAIRLAMMSNAAMRSGAGVVMLATPKSIAPYIIPNILESTIYPLSDADGEVVFDKTEIDGLISRMKTIAFGMGIGQSDEVKKILKYILSHYEGILIIDADGLNCLAQLDNDELINTTCKRVIVTPHLKEFSRLSGKSVDDIKSNSIELAMEYSSKNHVITLLKGPTTLVTNGDDVIFIDRGCPGMATAGSGDVLSGILAATCGYEHNEVDITKDKQLAAVALGAYINGRAGELAQEECGAVSMVAGDTVNHIKDVIKSC